MISTRKGLLRMLRLGLLFSSIGWGISFVFTFATWDFAVDQLYVMGADRIAYQPLLDYWLRMASAAFGCIGIASALACIRPAHFKGLIMLLGPFHGFMGVVLAASAVMNHLDMESHPTFIPDMIFCFLTGILITVPLVATCIQGRRGASGSTLHDRTP